MLAICSWQVVLSHAVHEQVPTLPDRIFGLANSETGRVHTIAVGGHPDRLFISPDGRELYAVDESESANVPVLDLDTQAVTRTLRLNRNPTTIAFSPDGQILYLGTLNDGLYVVNRANNEVTAIREGVKGGIHDLAITPDGKMLYLAMAYAGLERYNIRAGTFTRIAVEGCPKFLEMDIPDRKLFISSQCGGSRGKPLQDDVQVLDLGTDKIAYVLRSDLPTVAGPARLFPDRTRLWLDAWDACMNPHYRILNRIGCPSEPARAAYIFRLQDRSVLRSLNAGPFSPLSPPLFSSDGTRAMLPGKPARVVDTSFFNDQETLQIDQTTLQSPVFDQMHRRVYLAGVENGNLYTVDLPHADCSPPELGLVHHWPGDGTLSDRIAGKNLVWHGPAVFTRGLVGQAFQVEGSALEVSTPYGSLYGLLHGEGSLQLWVKLLGTGGNRDNTIAQLNYHQDPIWKLSVSASEALDFSGSLGCAGTGKIPLTPGRWHHVALVFSAQRIFGYIDGGLDLSLPCSKQVTKKSMQVTLLQFGPLHGLLDEPGIYDHPLTSNTLQRIIKQTTTCLTGTTSVTR